MAQIVGGNVDATWVLNGITGLAAFLFWNQLKDIKESIKALTDLIQSHDKEIALLKHQKSVDDDEFFEKLVNRIQNTIKAAKG